MLGIFKNNKKHNSGKSTLIKDKTIIKKPLVTLIILDGFGIHPDYMGNSVLQAKTPFLDAAWTNGVSTLINASGTYVGLPLNEQGNSEVGHINIGAGQIVQQTLPRINSAIQKNKFQNIPAFAKSIEESKKRKSDFHIMGILSAGGVHGHIEHLFKILDICAAKKVDPYVHVFLDGRDVGATDGYYYLSKLKQKFKELGVGKIASISGRFYSMDRDERWERTKLAYDCMTGIGKRTAKDAFSIIQESYKKGENDQVFVPTTMVGNDGSPVGSIKDNDIMFFYNFREDRMRQISQIFLDPNFDKIERNNLPENLFFVMMAGRDEGYGAHLMFEPHIIENTLSSALHNRNMAQLHVSETEKFAHITYFFNGGRKDNFNNEKFYKVPSPRVFDYSKVPKMSTEVITDQVIYELDRIDQSNYSFVLINFANPDMVGHTGDLKATIAANENADACSRRIVEKTVEKGGAAFIIADHGNCETMIDRLTHKKNTAHTNNPVPMIFLHDSTQLKPNGEKLIKVGTGENAKEPTGILADVAPSILKVLDVEKPHSMSGIDLINMI